MVKSLYLFTPFELSHIAQVAGVSPGTVSNWAKKYSWKQLKEAMAGGPMKIKADLYSQLVALHKDIQARPAPYPTSKEADVQSKLIKALGEIKEETSIHQTVQVITDLLEYVKHFATPEQAKSFASLTEGYLRKLSNNDGHE